MCLATCPGAQLSHTIETVYKSWAMLPESHGCGIWKRRLVLSPRICSVTKTLSKICGSDELVGKTGG